MLKKVKGVSIETHKALEVKVKEYARIIKDLIHENRNLVSTIEVIQNNQTLSVREETSIGHHELEGLLKSIKIPDYKKEMSVLLRGNDLIADLLTQLLKKQKGDL